LLGFTHTPGLLIGLLGAVVSGFGAALLWVSQGGYMMKLFSVYEIERDHQGTYLGIQNGIIYGNFILGSVITTFCLGLFDEKIYFIALVVVGLIAFTFCTFFLNNLDSKNPSIISE